MGESPMEGVPDITPISKRDATRYFNWRGWLRDMYVSAIRASTGSFLAFAGTNTAEALAPEALAHVGMDWKQAIAAAFSALIFDVARYINLRPLPEEQTAPPFQQ